MHRSLHTALLATTTLAVAPCALAAQSGGDANGAPKPAEPAAAAETITFTPGMRIQGRYAYDDIDGNNDFYIARVRLKAKGDVYGLATYYAEIKLDNVGRFAATVNAQIENAWLNFAVTPAFGVRIGLYDAVFSRNALTSDSKLLLIDRSLIKDDLTAIGLADNTVGVLAFGRPGGGRFEFGAGVFDNLQFDQGGSATARVASTVSDSMSSASPCAMRARVVAVAGATTIRSARRARATCSTPSYVAGSNMSVYTGRPVSDRNVNGVRNCRAACVRTTSTRAPACTSLLVRSAALYAAMLPVTPRTTLRSRSGIRRPRSSRTPGVARRA